MVKNRQISDILLILWEEGAALLFYSLVYALRKPYTAASFEELTFFRSDYKVAANTGQILGYVIAKFFNGLSLGCMWGVIFSFIEGRGCGYSSKLAVDEHGGSELVHDSIFNSLPPVTSIQTMCVRSSKTTKCL